MEREPETQVRRKKKQAPPLSKLKRLDTRHNKHWPLEGKRI
jgi:hypothetical protein